MARFAAEGLDPYYAGPESDFTKVHRCQLAELDRQYDVLNFDHSLEHMADPSCVMKTAFARVKPGGACVVSLPKLPSRAFEKHRANWYALDPPRHYFVPSVQGLSDLGKRTLAVSRDQSVLVTSAQMMPMTSAQHRSRALFHRAA